MFRRCINLYGLGSEQFKYMHTTVGRQAHTETSCSKASSKARNPHHSQEKQGTMEYLGDFGEGRSTLITIPHLVMKSGMAICLEWYPPLDHSQRVGFSLWLKGRISWHCRGQHRPAWARNISHIAGPHAKRNLKQFDERATCVSLVCFDSQSV